MIDFIVGFTLKDFLTIVFATLTLLIFVRVVIESVKLVYFIREIKRRKKYENNRF